MGPIPNSSPFDRGSLLSRRACLCRISSISALLSVRFPSHSYPMGNTPHFRRGSLRIDIRIIPDSTTVKFRYIDALLLIVVVSVAIFFVFLDTSALPIFRADCHRRSFSPICACLRFLSFGGGGVWKFFPIRSFDISLMGSRGSPGALTSPFIRLFINAHTYFPSTDRFFRG